MWNEKKTFKKKLIFFVSKFDQLPNPIPDDLKEILKRFWPGPLTIVYKGISYRMPNNPIILKLCEHLGPLYSTSANISGCKPIKNLREAKYIFKTYRDKFIIVYSGCPVSNIASTIYDYDRKEILREGEIPKLKIFN
ncbi:L-threonylcarbamoyladenylate synthase [Mycoplasma parvum]|nr:Sua5/YciO/YrdC/YwlC family protein [Mycoplasma parvum]